jgi:F1F0 ATPase subunit 2
MDEQRMTHPLLLLAHFALGEALGLLYFQGLWWNVRQLVQGRRAAVTVALGVARFLGLGVALFLTSREGGLPLLATVLGVHAARAMVLRSFKQVAA